MPGSAEWNLRADVIGRAMRLINDGVIDREGVERAGRAPRLQASGRCSATSAPSSVPGRWPSPVPSARTAPGCCLQTMVLPRAEVAFAAGFASVRQFNETIREVFALTPTELREARGRERKTRRLLPPPSADTAAPG